MKLSVYAQHLGISYRTAWRWFRAGKAAGYQVDTGTIIVTEPTIKATTTCARLYGQRRSKRKTERIIAELQNEEGDHPSQTGPGQSGQAAQAG